MGILPRILSSDWWDGTIGSKGIQVKQAYQKVGIGWRLYRIAEVYFKLRIMPDGKPSMEGNAFRERYEKKYGCWKGDFAFQDSDKDLHWEIVNKNEN